MGSDISYLTNAHGDYIEELYQSYKKDKSSVDPTWQTFFEGFEFASKYKSNGVALQTDIEPAEKEKSIKELHVLNLINSYRQRGHLFTTTNPVRQRRKYSPEISLELAKLSESDLDTVFEAGAEVGLQSATLREIRNLLEEAYCGSVGVEYKFIRIPEKVEWFQNKMESCRNKGRFDRAEKKYIYQKLMESVLFEKFLGTKFIGQKRFSLEGGDALIPALDFVIENGSEMGIKEFTIGMAHRGRLNVLANIFKKSFKTIFKEFAGEIESGENYRGDVKYHKGFSSDIITRGGKDVHLSLSPNPSHLEAVCPVTVGMTRSKTDFKYKNSLDTIAPILIHGDAAIAGQGVVYELLQMANLDAYKVGGTIHLVINNQIGFTTNYKEGRSSTYCTDIAKVTKSPIFHVNGDDVEAIAYTIKLAMEYRQKYLNDVFIDILCYRKYGHNESDEPKYTQPVLYDIIAKHPNPLKIYTDKLVQEKTFSKEELSSMQKEFKDKLQNELNQSKTESLLSEDKPFRGLWDNIKLGGKGDVLLPVETKVSKEKIIALGTKISTLPADLQVMEKTKKIFSERLKMVQQTHKFDWAMGELLAFASLLDEGKRVRMTGQDVERGTFSHRHAVVTIDKSEEKYIPLKKLSPLFQIHNSHLSEYAVLGFEYGYSLVNPHSLTIWEAQFGDFGNGAQIIIDQFIASGETKWKRSSGLVMLLPHGYEGQGPEHSSARIERFLELSAESNIQVVNCTTPANLFHALRRQIKRDFRKPLVIFTPKSLLRHPKVVSDIEEFTSEFHPIIEEKSIKKPSIKTLMLCSGKIYYELLDKKEKDNREDVAIVRIEQLYPLHIKRIKEIVASYENAKAVLWVQEEPANMGAWPYICRKLCYIQKMNMQLIGRKAMPCPAGGYLSVHKFEQEKIMNRAFSFVE